MLTCLRGRHRILCILDDLNHLLPERLVVQRLCDLHDRHLIADMETAELATGQPVNPATR